MHKTLKNRYLPKAPIHLSLQTETENLLENFFNNKFHLFYIVWSQSLDSLTSSWKLNRIRFKKKKNPFGDVLFCCLFNLLLHQLPATAIRCPLHTRWWAGWRWTRLTSQRSGSWRRWNPFFFQLLFLSACRSSLETRRYIIKQLSPSCGETWNAFVGFLQGKWAFISDRSKFGSGLTMRNSSMLGHPE